MNEHLTEIIKDAICEHNNNVRYNLSQVFGGLLYSVKLELEKEGIVCGIDDLIGIIMETSTSSGGDESYPVWVIDQRYPSPREKVLKDKAQKIMTAIENILKSHGINPHHHIF